MRTCSVEGGGGGEGGGDGEGGGEGGGGLGDGGGGLGEGGGGLGDDGGGEGDGGGGEGNGGGGEGGAAGGQGWEVSEPLKEPLMVQHVAVAVAPEVMNRAEPWSCREKAMTEQSSGAMERYTWVRFAGKLTPCQTDTWQQSAHQWGDG